MPRPRKQVQPAPKRHADPLQAIRAHCLQCSCGSRNEVERCKITDCALWPFRSVSALEKQSNAPPLEGQMTMYDFL